MGFHVVYLAGTWSVSSFQLFFSRVFISYLVYGCGVLVYSLRFPEKLIPGTFDIVVRYIPFERIYLRYAVPKTCHFRCRVDLINCGMY
jgi:predicted membrane channel-forming protein YqfA (hemolysin III family)